MYWPTLRQQYQTCNPANIPFPRPPNAEAQKPFAHSSMPAMRFSSRKKALLGYGCRSKCSLLPLCRPPPPPGQG